MPSIRTIALFGVLATLATDARPVEELKKRVECARHMAVDEQVSGERKHKGLLDSN